VRIIIAGSRSMSDREFLYNSCDRMIGKRVPECVVSGLARGADMLGHNYAVDRGITIKEFPADWNMFGKAAGMIRNSAMARYAADAPNGMLIAFWDGQSRGTRDMIMKAFDCRLETHVIRFRAEGDGVIVRRES
jgi:hypothetical protein